MYMTERNTRHPKLTAATIISWRSVSLSLNLYKRYGGNNDPVCWVSLFDDLEYIRIEFIVCSKEPRCQMTQIS